MHPLLLWPQNDAPKCLQVSKGHTPSFTCQHTLTEAGLLCNKKLSRSISPPLPFGHRSEEVDLARTILEEANCTHIEEHSSLLADLEVLLLSISLQTLTEGDRARIEKRVEQAVKEGQKFERVEVTRDEALAMFLENKFKSFILKPTAPPESIHCYGVYACQNYVKSYQTHDVFCKNPEDEIMK
eukprot:1153677-Pelagomonas_calceolata.AAC.5